jgi:hypothetical protein
MHILGLVIFKFHKLSKQQSILDELEIHIRSMVCQENYLIALKKHDLMSDRIYHVYTMYISGIYYTYTCKGHLRARLVAHARLEASVQDFPRIFSVLARLGPYKVPQPGVDLVNMAAPPRVRASAIGTAALKSVLLSAAVLVWNS